MPSYSIREYPLQQGALEIAFIEEYFNEFPTRKSATEIINRLDDREMPDPDGRRAAAGRPGDLRAGLVQGVARAAGDRRRSEAGRPGGAAAGRRSSSTAGRFSTTGSARRGSTGAARATSARSPKSRKSGPSPRATTKSSSRPRTGTTTCAARSTACSSTSSNSSRRRIRSTRRCT